VTGEPLLVRPKKVFQPLPRGMEILIGRDGRPAGACSEAGAPLLVPDLTMRGAGGTARLAEGQAAACLPFGNEQNIRSEEAMTQGRIQVRRAYEERQPGDGTRVLVDRIWPRGLTKAKAALDEWCKDVAPSDELRKWYGHDPGRFEEFGCRYRLELQGPRQAEALAHLRGLAQDRQLTLLTATRRPEISEAAVLAALLVA